MSKIEDQKPLPLIENDKVKLTGIVIGAIIFCAYLKQYLYYDYFKIQIEEYIEIEDVLTPFIMYLFAWAFFIAYFITIIQPFVHIFNLLKPNIDNSKYGKFINGFLAKIIFCFLLDIFLIL